MFEPQKNESNHSEPDSPKESVETTEDLSTRYYAVDLPSSGKLGYPSEIEYRDILVRDEKILSTATGANYEKILNKILKSLLKDQSWYDDISIYDRDFLLLWIWANNYSTEKTFEVTCPHCKAKDDVVVDVTKITIDEISEDYTNPFIMELSNGETVKLRMVTIGDENIAVDFATKNKGKHDVDDIKFAITMQFDTVLPLSQKLEYMSNNITGRDMGMIRAFHDHFKYGIDDKVSHSCNSCAEVTSFTIPFSLEFFLPTLRNYFEKMLHSNKTHGNKSD